MVGERILQYLSDWKASVQKQQGFNKTEKERMLLDEESRYGLKMTCEFVFTFAYWSYIIHRQVIH